MSYWYHEQETEDILVGTRRSLDSSESSIPTVGTQLDAVMDACNKEHGLASALAGLWNDHMTPQLYYSVERGRLSCSVLEEMRRLYAVSDETMYAVARNGMSTVEGLDQNLPTLDDLAGTVPPSARKER